jgi:hypothetical protein
MQWNQRYICSTSKNQNGGQNGGQNLKMAIDEVMYAMES